MTVSPANTTGCELEAVCGLTCFGSSKNTEDTRLFWYSYTCAFPVCSDYPLTCKHYKITTPKQNKVKQTNKKTYLNFGIRNTLVQKSTFVPPPRLPLIYIIYTDPLWMKPGRSHTTGTGMPLLF